MKVGILPDSILPKMLLDRLVLRGAVLQVRQRPAPSAALACFWRCLLPLPPLLLSAALAALCPPLPPPRLPLQHFAAAAGRGGCTQCAAAGGGHGSWQMRRRDLPARVPQVTPSIPGSSPSRSL